MFTMQFFLYTLLTDDHNSAADGDGQDRWSDQIRYCLDIKFHDALHEAKDRSRWRTIVQETLDVAGESRPSVMRRTTQGGRRMRYQRKKELALNRACI